MFRQVQRLSASSAAVTSILISSKDCAGTDRSVWPKGGGARPRAVVLTWITMVTTRTLLTIVGLLILPALGGLEPAKGFQQAGFEQTLVAGTLDSPTAMEFAPDGRLFVAEKSGSLRVIKNGALLPTDFVTLSVTSNSERGLLGIAFDPEFATNRFVYVYYT